MAAGPSSCEPNLLKSWGSFETKQVSLFFPRDFEISALHSLAWPRIQSAIHALILPAAFAGFDYKILQDFTILLQYLFSIDSFAFHASAVSFASHLASFSTPPDLGLAHLLLHLGLTGFVSLLRIEDRRCELAKVGIAALQSLTRSLCPGSRRGEFFESCSALADICQPAQNCRLVSPFSPCPLYTLRRN